MKFILDAHLPIKLCRLFQRHGHDCTHTLDLSERNRTSDSEIMRFADTHNLVVVTKDADFVSSYYVRQTPKKLLLISTGNIRNVDLEALLDSNMATIASLLAENSFIEITKQHVTIR